MVLTTQTANSRVCRPERVPDAEHVTIYYDPDYHASAVSIITSGYFQMAVCLAGERLGRARLSTPPG